MKKLLNICIPTFEDETSLKTALERIPRDLWPDIGVVAIILPDKNPAFFESYPLFLRYPKIRFIEGNRKWEYGLAVRKGLGLCREADSEYTACFRAGRNSVSETLVKLVSHMEIYDMDLLQGSRPPKDFATRGFSAWVESTLVGLENRYLDLKLSDMRPGCMVYARKAMRSIPFEKLSMGDAFDIEVLACARELNLRIGELQLPAREWERQNAFAQSVQVLKVLTKYKLGYYRENPKV